MKIGDAFARADRLQKSRRFKIIATILIVALGVASLAAWFVVINAPGGPGDRAQALQTQPTPRGAEGGQSARATDIDALLADPSQTPGPRIEPRQLREMIGSRDATTGVVLGVTLATGVAVLVVWLGLFLTYLSLLACVALVAAPLYAAESTQGLAKLLVGLAALTASFAAVLEALRLALGGPWPVAAVARNVLNEAVRMKISVVFIVMLIIMLATLPGLLDAAQPLRYRVQTFMQASVTTTYWVLALLTLFFSVATVAFEQRDRTIWQTMAKPVAPWQYLLGKWTGIMAVNLALLSVAASGLFLFTEYLRGTPASGEVRAYVNASGEDIPTQDRLMLESEVLVARESRTPSYPALEPDAFRQAFDARLNEFLMRGEVRNRATLERELRDQILSEYSLALRTIDPASSRRFVFEGLGEARGMGRPVTLRFKIQSGSNNPSEMYRLLLVIADAPLQREAGLNVAQTISLRPDAIDEDGRLRLEIYNGDPISGRVNPWSITIPPDGLEVLYVAGGYEANFLRVMAALWLKLGFIAAVGVAAATFLSFPVACFLTFLVLFSAQTAGYLTEAIDVYVGMQEKHGMSKVVQWIVTSVAGSIAWLFGAYSDLRPNENLVEGRLLSWGQMARSVLILVVWTAGALAAGWAIFRKRELAIYSGH